MEFVTLARPYAIAAFSYAKEANKLEEWEQYLRLSCKVASNAKIKYMLSSPEFTFDERASSLSNLINVNECGVDIKYQNFLKLLSLNNRLVLLTDILIQFIKLKMQNQNRKNVTIYSSHKLSDEQQNKILQKINKVFGNNIEIEVINQIDSSFIGGIKICCDDWVYEDTITSRLNKLAKALTA